MLEEPNHYCSSMRNADSLFYRRYLVLATASFRINLTGITQNGHFEAFVSVFKKEINSASVALS